MKKRFPAYGSNIFGMDFSMSTFMKKENIYSLDFQTMKKGLSL
jgi:hypothetical protein